jgi:hypothetical protein
VPCLSVPVPVPEDPVVASWYCLFALPVRPTNVESSQPLQPAAITRPFENAAAMDRKALLVPW